MNLSATPKTNSRTLRPRRFVRGFTLVELVTTLLILSALATSALPNYVDLTDDAQKAAVSRTAGSFWSGLAMAQAACLVKDWANRDNLPGYAGGVVDFNASCLPTDTSGNQNTIGNNDNRCLRVWNAVLSAAPTVTTSTSGADYQASGQRNVCTYRYLHDGDDARLFTYSSLTGDVALTNP